MKYEKAKKSDLPALTKLWQACFGDSVAAVNEFWKVFDHIEVFIARETVPVAMLCALPITYFDEAGEAHMASYFYAICTAESHRGRGISTKLIAFAEANVRSDLVFLTPASESLFHFYRKSGYETACYHNCYQISAEGKAKIQPIDAAGYQNLRQMQLYADFISYDVRLISLQSGLYRIETKDAICCAAAEKSGEDLLIKELLPDIPEAAAALASHLGCKSALVRTMGGDLPFGMCKRLRMIPCPENTYLGLAFD